MPAHVDEAVELPFGVARDQDGHAARSCPTTWSPGEASLASGQSSVQLWAKIRWCSSSATFGIGVPAGRQRPAVVERVGDLVEAESVFRCDCHLYSPNPALAAVSIAVS